MLKRLLAVTLAFALAGITSWSSGPPGTYGAARAMPLPSAGDELAWPGGGGGGAGAAAPMRAITGIAGEAGLGDAVGYE